MQITYIEKTSYTFRLQKMDLFLWKYISKKTQTFLVFRKLSRVPGERGSFTATAEIGFMCESLFVLS